jgi:hypothetical protein
MFEFKMGDLFLELKGHFYKQDARREIGSHITRGRFVRGCQVTLVSAALYFIFRDFS